MDHPVRSDPFPHVHTLSDDEKHEVTTEVNPRNEIYDGARLPTKTHRCVCYETYEGLTKTTPTGDFARFAADPRATGATRNTSTLPANKDGRRIKTAGKSGLLSFRERRLLGEIVQDAIHLLYTQDRHSSLV